MSTLNAFLVAFRSSNVGGHGGVDEVSVTAVFFTDTSATTVVVVFPLVVSAVAGSSAIEATVPEDEHNFYI